MKSTLVKSEVESSKMANVEQQIADADRKLKEVDRELDKLQRKRRDLIKLKEKLTESQSRNKVKEIEEKNDWSHGK